MDNISIGSDDSGSTTYERRQFASTLVTSTDDYDSILVAMEEETIEAEIRWLLATEFKTVLPKIKASLLEITDLVDKSKNYKDDFEVDYRDDARVLSFEAPGRVLEGSLAIRGWNVAECKMAVKFSKMKDRMIFNIATENPWKLTQLHNACNYIMLASEEIQALELMEASDLMQVTRSIDKVTNFLKNASDQFLVSPPERPSNRYASSVFFPKLPPNLCVQIDISNSSLFISAFNINQQLVYQKNQTKSVSQSNLLVTSQGLSKDDVIIEQAHWEIPLKKIKSLNEMISTAYGYCMEFREKSNALSRLNL